MVKFCVLLQKSSSKTQINASSKEEYILQVLTVSLYVVDS